MNDFRYFSGNITGKLLGGSNAPKFWVGHGTPGPRCSASPGTRSTI